MLKFIGGVVVAIAIVGGIIYWLVRGGILQLSYQALRQGILRVSQALGTVVGQQANRLRRQGQQLERQGQRLQQEAARVEEQASQLGQAAEQLRRQAMP